jgi:hypothetical protein
MPVRHQYIEAIWGQSKQTLATHGNAIRNSYSIVLPCQHIISLDIFLNLFTQVQHYGSVNLSIPRGGAALAFSEPMGRTQCPEAVTYSACCSIVSTMTTTTWGAQNCSLAWVAFPPHARNTYMRLRFHGFL